MIEIFAFYDFTRTTVFVSCTAFAIADFIFNHRWLLFDEVLALCGLKIKLDCQCSTLLFSDRENIQNLQFSARYWISKSCPLLVNIMYGTCTGRALQGHIERVDKFMKLERLKCRLHVSNVYICFVAITHMRKLP